MSRTTRARLGLSRHEAAALGADGATRVRLFRLVLGLAQRLRTRMDERLRPGGLTTQQAALISVVDAMGSPPLSGAAREMGSTHQNVMQIARALERKGFLRIVTDARDARVRRLVTTRRSERFWQLRSHTDQLEVTGWFSGLSSRDARTLFRLLLRLERGVRAAPGAASPPRRRER